MLMTLVSCISCQRSFPSRVRSPTPANTEMPPWCWAMLLISSWMMTVLPTPAPPKRPVLPPRVYGSRRSTTLMPVSSIWAEVACSSNVGAGRWIGYVLPPGTGPSLSTGSPTMLRIRPRVPFPTGTEMGLPVSLTLAPRTRPSVEAMATVRTVASPRCWATSRTSRLLEAKASLISRPCTSRAL